VFRTDVLKERWQAREGGGWEKSGAIGTEKVEEGGQDEAGDFLLGRYAEKLDVEYEDIVFTVSVLVRRFVRYIVENVLL
jgi:hypothetical protein